jgi:hypothetical protein
MTVLKSFSICTELVVGGTSAPRRSERKWLTSPVDGRPGQRRSIVKTASKQGQAERERDRNRSPLALSSPNAPVQFAELKKSESFVVLLRIDGGSVCSSPLPSPLPC